VTAGMAVFDTMRHVRPDVSTVCVGLAASMGTFSVLAFGCLHICVLMFVMLDVLFPSAPFFLPPVNRCGLEQ
jgi:hypothetical protein